MWIQFAVTNDGSRALQFSFNSLSFIIYWNIIISLYSPSCKRKRNDDYCYYYYFAHYRYPLRKSVFIVPIYIYICIFSFIEYKINGSVETRTVCEITIIIIIIKHPVRRDDLPPVSRILLFLLWRRRHKIIIIVIIFCYRKNATCGNRSYRGMRSSAYLMVRKLNLSRTFSTRTIYV